MALIFLVCLFTAGLGPILYSTKVLRDDPVKHGSSKASFGDASLCPSEEVTSHLSTFLASESSFYQSAGTDPTEERTVTIEHFLQPSDLKGAEGTVSNLNAIISPGQKATPAIFHSGVKTSYPVETTGPAVNAEAPYNHSFASFSLDSLNDEDIRSVAQISVAGKFLKTFQSFVLFLAGVLIGIFCSYCNIFLPHGCIWRYGGPREGHGAEGRTLDTELDRFEGQEGSPLSSSPVLSAPSLVDNCSDYFLHDAADISLSYCGHEATRGMYTDDDGIRCQDTEVCSSLTLSVSSGNGDLKLDLAGLSGARCAGSIGKTEQGSDAGHIDEGQDPTVLFDDDTYSDKLDREDAPSDSGHECFDTRSDGETPSLEERCTQDGNAVSETTSLSSVGSVIGNSDGSVNSALDVDERATEDHTTYDTSENIMNSLYIPPHKRPTAPLPFRTIGVESSSSCLEPKSLSKTRQSQYDFYKTFLEGFRPGQGPSMLINDMLHGGVTVDGDLDRRPRQSKSFLLGKWIAPRLIADRLHRVIRESKDTAACGQLATQDVADTGEIDVGVAGSSSDVGPGGFSAKGTGKSAEFKLNSIPDVRKRILETEDDSECKIPKGRKKRKSNAASPKRARSHVLLLPEDLKSRMKVSSEDDACAEMDGADVAIRASEFRDCTFAVKGTNATDESGDFEARERNESA